MKRVRSGVTGAVALLSAAVMLSGCGLSAEERISVQEKQLQSFIERADTWGEEIIAQIPEDEVELLSDEFGGSRGARDHEQWPRYYYFARIVVLRSDGPRTPTQMADSLEPWLADEGWERDEEREYPPYRDSFEREYFRDGYHLTLQVYTQLPPLAQSIDITIVTPTTDPTGASMGEHPDSEANAGPSVGRAVAFVVCAIVPVVVAVPMTVFGRFLSYAGLVTTQADVVFMLFLSIASIGPTVLALVSIVWGAQRLATDRGAPFAVPLLGALAMPVLYYVCALILAS